jgi:hypothetical protein
VTQANVLLPLDRIPRRRVGIRPGRAFVVSHRPRRIVAVLLEGNALRAYQGSL